jgi:hypothetical protein
MAAFNIDPQSAKNVIFAKIHTGKFVEKIRKMSELHVLIPLFATLFPRRSQFPGFSPPGFPDFDLKIGHQTGWFIAACAVRFCTE